MLRERFPDKFALVIYGTELIQKKVTLTAAQVKALNTTPQILVPAPGVGYFVDVFAITASIPIYVSAAYATNTTLEFRHTNGSGTKVSADIANLLAATAAKTVTVKSVATELVNIANAPVVVFTPSGNPATGDSPVEITITYRVLKV